MGILDETRTTETTNFSENSLGLTASLARELTPLVKFNLDLGYTITDESAPTQRTDETYNATTGFTFQLNTGLTASAAYSFVYRRSNQPGQDVRQNSLIFGIRKSI